MGRRTMVGVSRLGNLLGAMEAGARSVCKIPPAAGANMKKKSILVFARLKIGALNFERKISLKRNEFGMSTKFGDFFHE